MSDQQQTDHQRVRRELWAAIYRQAHEATVNASALRVEPEFRWAEAADRALTQFDKRFSTPGVARLDPLPEGPSPLAISEALHEAAAAIYFADSSDYLPALWSVVRNLAPGIAELLEKHPSAAYHTTDAERDRLRADGAAVVDEREQFEAAMGEELKVSQGQYALSRAHMTGRPYTFLATIWAWEAWQRARGVAGTVPLAGGWGELREGKDFERNAGVPADGDAWEQAALDILANARPIEEIKHDIANIRERLAHGVAPSLKDQPISDAEVEIACHAAHLHVTRESMRDMRRALETLVNGRALGVDAGQAEQEKEGRD